MEASLEQGLKIWKLTEPGEIPSGKRESSDSLRGRLVPVISYTTGTEAPESPKVLVMRGDNPSRCIEYVCVMGLARLQERHQPVNDPFGRNILFAHQAADWSQMR